MTPVRCSRCILPDSFPDLSFDADGVCNWCHEYDRRFQAIDYATAERRLLEIFAWARRKKRAYDCVLGVSGGKDSTYALYLLKEVYGLEVLAIHQDNGFISGTARENIQRAVEVLNVPLVERKSPWGDMKAAYVSQLKRQGGVCMVCVHNMHQGMNAQALQEAVPLQVIAASRDELFPNNWMNYVCTSSDLNEVFEGDLGARQLKVVELPKLRSLRKRRARRKYIHLPNYVRWDLRRVLQTIEGELGWENPHQRIHETDCRIYPAVEHLLRRQKGFGRTTVELSNYIRSGQLTREEALASELQEQQSGEPPSLGYLLDRLDLTRDEVPWLR